MTTARTARKSRTQPDPLEARARYFRILGDPTRLQILEALLEGERSVSELVEIARAPQSRVSNHLACLKWCRVVASDRRGRQVIYRVVDERVAEMLKTVRTLSSEHCDFLVNCRRIGPEWI